MSSKPINFYIGNHGKAAHISDFVDLVRHECVEIGVSVIVTNTLFKDRLNVILENFENPKLVEALNSKFSHRDVRLLMIATEVLRDGVFDSASAGEVEKQLSASRKDHYESGAAHWHRRTKGFFDVQDRFGAIICPAEIIVEHLQDEVSTGSLFYWPLRYLKQDPRRKLKPSYNEESITHDLAFTGTLTHYRENALKSLVNRGVRCLYSPASTPDFLRYAFASQSIAQFAPKHFSDTPQVSKMRLHWALNLEFPILVERCSSKSDLDPFVIKYESNEELIHLVNEKLFLTERSNDLRANYIEWSSEQKSVFKTLGQLGFFSSDDFPNAVGIGQTEQPIERFKERFKGHLSPDKITPSVFARNLKDNFIRDKKNRSVVGIYVHGRSYRSELIHLYRELKKSDDFQLILFIGEAIGDELEEAPEALVVKPVFKYAAEIDFVDLIITTTPVMAQQLPKGALKVYLAHDINDSPLGDLDHQESLLKFYDFIYVAGKASGDQFRELIAERIKEPVSVSGAVKVVETGYPKLDRLIGLPNNSIPRDKIIICPTALLPEWDASTLSPNSLIEILDVLSMMTIDGSQAVVFRPHPHFLDSPCRLLFERLIAERRYPNLLLEINEDVDYAKLYSSSEFMITDFSGTGSTYMAAFLRPTFYYVPNGFPLGTGRVTDSVFRENGLVVNSKAHLKRAAESYLTETGEANRAKFEGIRDCIVANVGKSLGSIKGHIERALIEHKMNRGK